MESDIDLQGLFALDPEVRPGILELRVKITVGGDSDDETLKKIAMLGYNFPRYQTQFEKVSKRFLKLLLINRKVIGFC